MIEKQKRTLNTVLQNKEQAKTPQMQDPQSSGDLNALYSAFQKFINLHTGIIKTEVISI